MSSWRKNAASSVTVNTIASARVARQAIRTRPRSSIRRPMRTRWAARHGTGMKLTSGVTKNSAASTSRLLASAATCVRAPLWRLAPLRANDAEPGIAPNALHARLPSPIATSSWLASSRWPERAASVLAMETASSMPRMAMASAEPSSGGTRPRLPALSGMPRNVGSETASAPSSAMVRTPSARRSANRAKSASRTSTGSSGGTFGAIFSAR